MASFECRELWIVIPSGNDLDLTRGVDLSIVV